MGKLSKKLDASCFTTSIRFPVYATYVTFGGRLTEAWNNMGWIDTLISDFHKETPVDGTASAAKGFWLVLFAQRPLFYVTILWELFATFVIYVPGTDLLRIILRGVNRKWSDWSREQRLNVIAFLHNLDRKGEVTKEFCVQ